MSDHPAATTAIRRIRTGGGAGHRLVAVAAAFALVALAGCARAPDAIIGIDNPRVPAASVAGAIPHDIFFATTRAPDEDRAVMYSGERGESVGFARVTVSIPPTHKSGEIERAKRLPPDPRTAFAVLDPARFADGRDFIAAIDRALAARPAPDRTVLVFVHGYNTTLAAALLRTTQFVQDTGYRGVPVLFTWASRGRTVDYVYDINSALHARDALLGTAQLLATTRASGFDIVAHSMGNLLTIEAMRQAQLEGWFNRSKRLRHVILASPDIDFDVFRAQMALLPRGERRFFVLISEDDRALGLSRRIAGGVDRVGDASAEDLAALGVTVIDLSDVRNRGGLNHTKFAESPEVVQLIGNGILAGNSLQTSEQTGGIVDQLSSAVLAVPKALASGGAILIVGGQGP